MKKKIGLPMQILIALILGIVVGLVCGMGDYSKVSTAQIDCKAVGDKPETVKINTSGNTVTVDFEK